MSNNSSIMYNPLVPKRESTDNDSQEDCETLLSNGSETSYKRAPRRNLFWLYFSLIPMVSTCLIGFGAWIGSRWLVPNADSICPSWGQQYCTFRTMTEMRMGILTENLIAPILKEVDNSIQMVRFNGSFMKESAFRLGAGPEVDAAWESIGVGCKSINQEPPSKARD